jgi:hypothetical protein
MGLPWFRILGAVVGLAEVVRQISGRTSTSLALEEPGTRRGGRLEARMAGTVMAAIREAFDRDYDRERFEREQREIERRRAERLLRIELARQAGEREIGRQRLLTGLAAVIWLGTVALTPVLDTGSVATRIALGLGWALLLGALGSALAAQSVVTAALARLDEKVGSPSPPEPGGSALAVPWLLLTGCAVIALGVLLR